MSTIIPISTASSPIAPSRNVLFRRLSRGPSRWPIDIVFIVIETLVLWAERSRQRRELAALNDRALKDIGLCRIDALRESEKPFWRL